MARGNPVTDDSGSRQATLLFPTGTVATLRTASGATQPLPAPHIRATEYSVGATGPQSLPGALGASMAYAYSVELSADGTTLVYEISEVR